MVRQTRLLALIYPVSSRWLKHSNNFSIELEFEPPLDDKCGIPSASKSPQALVSARDCNGDTNEYWSCFSGRQELPDTVVGIDGPNSTAWLHGRVFC